MFRAITITFILALTSAFVFAQTPGKGSIAGQVVDENGQPLHGAIVYIRANRPNADHTVRTDREGRFQVDGLEPFDYSVTVQMPAYFPDGAKLPRGPLRVGDRVTLTMIKGGVLTGRVIDANGDPVVNVNVRAELVRYYGRPTSGGWVQGKATDDRGIYRIYGLLEGTYVVFAGGPGRLKAQSSETVFEFDVPTYAPSSTRETAAEFNVRMGEEVTGADIRYRGEQGRIISGNIIPVKSHTSFGVRMITGGEAGTHAETFTSGNFVFKGVADGNYSLIAQSYGPDGEVAISETKQVTVQGADVTGIKLTTKLLGSVSGRVVLDETKLADCNSKDHPLSTETSVFAWFRDDEAAKQIPRFVRPKDPARPNEKGDFVLQDLAPGSYYFGPSLRARQWYVHSITFGPPPNATTKTKHTDATRVWTNVKMEDRLSGLTITLAQGGASLRGGLELAPGERAPEGSFLILVPAEREKANDVLRFFTTPVDRNGTFELNNVAPGRYWVLTQMAAEDPTASPSAKVRLPHESETRAQLRREAEAAKIEIEIKPCQDVVGYKLPLKPKE